MSGPNRDDEAMARKREQAVEELRALQREGWVWSETTLGVLVSPPCWGVYVRYDPSAGDVLFCPLLVEMIRDQLREERGW
jgi:hypothetical protein